MIRTTAFRDAAWLTGARARRWMRPFVLAMYGGLAALIILMSTATIGDKPPALDFDAFWAAGRFVQTGQPARAYDDKAIEAIERAATRLPPGYLGFWYPPPYLLLCAPLGLLGVMAALYAFLAVEMGLLLAALRRIVPRAWGWLPILAFPGFVMNALSGQNAPLSAACFAAGAIWLERRPVLAGLCLSGLIYKPQLGLCLPVALLAARRFRAFFACGVGAAALLALSWLVLGTATWQAFLGHGVEVSGNVGVAAMIWPKMQTVYSAVRMHAGLNTAIAAHAVFAVAVLLWLVVIGLRRPGALVEIAAITTATMLVTPFLLDYDLAILCVPMACLARMAWQSGWLPYERVILLAAFVLPLFARAGGMMVGVTIGPIVMLALMGLIWKRSA